MLVLTGIRYFMITVNFLPANLNMQEGIGLIAINDSFCLEGQIYQILRKCFRNQPYYTDVLDLFHEVTRQQMM